MNAEKVRQLEEIERDFKNKVDELRKPYMTNATDPRAKPEAMPPEVEAEQADLIGQWERAAQDTDKARKDMEANQERSAYEDRLAALQGRNEELVKPAPLPQPRSQVEELTKGRDKNGFRWEQGPTAEESARYLRNASPAYRTAQMGPPKSRNLMMRNADYEQMRSQDRSGLDQERMIQAFMDYSEVGRKDFTSFGLRGDKGREELRAFQIDLDVGGGYLRPPDAVSADVIQEVDDMVYIRQKANVIQTRIGQEYRGRVRNQRQGDAEWTSELQAIAEDDSVEYGMYHWSPHRLTKLLMVSRDMLQMGSDIFMQEFSSEAMYAFDITQEKAFLLGNGAGQPQGVLTLGPDGGPIDSSRRGSHGNAANAINYDGANGAKFALKAQHRRMAAWMFHRDACRNLYEIKDNEGRPLFRNALAEGETDMFHGLPMMESEYMPNTFTTGQVVGIVANWRHYRIVESKTFEVQILDQVMAIQNQVVYLFRWYLDAKPDLGEAFSIMTLG